MQSSKTDTEKRSRHISFIAAALAAVGTIAAGIASLYSSTHREFEIMTRDFEARRAVSDLEDRLQLQRAQLASREQDLVQGLAQARAELEGLTVRLSARNQTQLSAAVTGQLQQVAAATAKLSTQLDAVGDQQNLLDKRLKEIETVVLADPTKALSLPLLQREVQSLTQQLDRGLASAKSDSDRIYDLMKWVLGLMGLVSLSLVGTAVGNVFKKDPAKDSAAGGSGQLVKPGVTLLNQNKQPARVEDGPR